MSLEDALSGAKPVPAADCQACGAAPFGVMLPIAGIREDGAMVGGHRRLRVRHAASALAGILGLAIAAVSAAAQQPPKIHPPEPKKPEKKEVHGEGCVKAGVQAHCIVLRDMKTGHLYDLLFKGDRPPVGLGIEFAGVPHHGATACMQGTPVDVTRWAHKAAIKCAPGQAGKP